MLTEFSQNTRTDGQKNKPDSELTSKVEQEVSQNTKSENRSVTRTLQANTSSGTSNQNLVFPRNKNYQESFKSTKRQLDADTSRETLQGKRTSVWNNTVTSSQKNRNLKLADSDEKRYTNLFGKLLLQKCNSITNLSFKIHLTVQIPYFLTCFLFNFKN